MTNIKFDHITVQDIQSLRSFLNTNIYPTHLEDILNKSLGNDYNANLSHSNEVFVDSTILPDRKKSTINTHIIKKIMDVIQHDYLNTIVDEYNTFTSEELEFIFDKFSNLLFHITNTPDGVIIHL